MISRVFHAHRPCSWTSSHAFFPVGPATGPTGKPERHSDKTDAKQQGEDGATQKKTADEAPFGGRGAADLGVFEGAQPLHQAPWGAVAKRRGENGGT